jgi:hypothetical protein
VAYALEFQRKFHPFNLASHNAPKELAVASASTGTDVAAGVTNYYSYPSYLFADGKLTPTRISAHPGQIFPMASTEFERAWSLLCAGGAFVPVVNPEYYVVGHLGAVREDSDQLFVPRGFARGELDPILKASRPVYVSKGNPDRSRFEDYCPGRQLRFLVLTDPFGKVVAVLGTESGDALKPPDIDPLMLISLAQIGVAIGAAVGRFLVLEAIDGAAIVAATFRQAMLGVEKKLVARGASLEANGIRSLTEEELAMSVGGGASRPLTSGQLDRAIEILRDGKDVHVESLGQMRQIQGELGQLGVRSESASTKIPQRAQVNAAGQEELPASFQDSRGTYRSDPAHGPGDTPYNAHNEYEHLNITLRNGKTLAVLVTGARNF